MNDQFLVPYLKTRGTNLHSYKNIFYGKIRPQFKHSVEIVDESAGVFVIFFSRFIGQFSLGFSEIRKRFLSKHYFARLSIIRLVHESVSRQNIFPNKFNSRVIYIKWFQCFKPLLCLFFLFQDYTAAFQLKFIGDSVCLFEFFVKVKNQLGRKSKDILQFLFTSSVFRF